MARKKTPLPDVAKSMKSMAGIFDNIKMMTGSSRMVCIDATDAPDRCYSMVVMAEQARAIVEMPDVVEMACNKNVLIDILLHALPSLWVRLTAFYKQKDPAALRAHVRECMLQDDRRLVSTMISAIRFGHGRNRLPQPQQLRILMRSVVNRFMELPESVVETCREEMRTVYGWEY